MILSAREGEHSLSNELINPFSFELLVDHGDPFSQNVEPGESLRLNTNGSSHPTEIKSTSPNWDCGNPWAHGTPHRLALGVSIPFGFAGCRIWPPDN